MTSEVDGVAFGALCVGAIFAYGGVTGKSPLQTLHSIVLGNSPSTVAQTEAITLPAGPSYGPDSANPGTQGNLASVSGSGWQPVNGFLISKNLSRVARAGVLGNIKVESGFSPTASNAKEGAIGICQWELGRRTALQSFARAHGTTETDLNAQLGYMWQELTSSHALALAGLKIATTPAAAATVFDELFEASAGTTRSDRISAANSFYTQIS